tara:strand:- start:244 stop:666 length:423 start_codon:yes stop_codon:yes gene_type:complete
MAFDNTLTIVGNVVREPELKFLNSGIALLRFSIADNQKKANGEEEAHFFDCVAWRELAENLAESINKGQRVIVHGKLKQDRWDTPEGDKRSKVEITVETAGHCLKFQTATAQKAQREADTGGGWQRGPSVIETVPDHEPF